MRLFKKNSPHHKKNFEFEENDNKIENGWDGKSAYIYEFRTMHAHEI